MNCFEIINVGNVLNGLVIYDLTSQCYYFAMLYIYFAYSRNYAKISVLPLMPRICENDYPIPDSKVILEKGTAVLVTNFGIHYDPEYYPDPMRFDPERFTSENKAKRPFCSFIPFGEAQRTCIGKKQQPLLKSSTRKCNICYVIFANVWLLPSIIMLLHLLDYPQKCA